MTNKAEVTPPNFSLQKKLGAPIKHLPLSVLKAADKALARHAASFDGYFSEIMTKWKNSPDLPIDALYNDAHDLRCFAGTFDRVALGKVADALCIYIESAKAANASLDPAAVKAIKDAISTCASLDAVDPEAGRKIADHAHEAVKVKIAALQKA